MKRVVSVIGICLVWASGAAAQSSSQLTLDETIAIAMANNRTLQNATLSEERAEREIAIARSRRLPSFSLETQASRLLRPVDITFPKGAFGDFPSTGPVPNEDAVITTPARVTMFMNASVSQPLTQLFQANLNVRLNEAGLDFERERTRSLRLSVVNGVKRAYYALLQTSSAVEAAQANARLLQELDRVVGNRVTQQVALKADGLEVQTRLAQVEVTLLTLRNSLSSGKEQLNRLLGRDVRTPFEVAGVPEPTRAELDVDAAVARALASRPDVREARVRVQQAELSRRIARADYIPEVGLALQSYSPVNIDGAPGNITSVGIQLKWEPFDWGRKSQAVAAKALQVRQAGNALSDAEDDVIIDIHAQFRKLEEARAKLRVAALSQQTAEENARVRVARYQTQAALLSDVLQSQASYADAINQYQQSLLSLLTATADFEQALGEDVTK